MIHTPTKQNFAGAKFASVLSYNMKRADKLIQYQPRQRQENIDHLSHNQKKKISILDSKAPEKMYKRFTPKEWIAQHNLCAELDHMGIEFEEVPKEWENMPNLWKAEQVEKIDRARKVIYHGVVKQGWITANDVTIDNLLDLWNNITEVNSTRAFREIQKDRLITSKIQVWILNKIRDSKMISPTRLQSEVFKELEYKTPTIAKNALNRGLKSLLDSNCIELKVNKGKGKFSNYILKNVEFDGNDFLRGEK
ncbi:MAG: hypothetical protein GY936_00110 [Ignavibacteriae bacterium]|nr:hypothetical protein [Ignavibacteriota bacterium]